jgi:hypothetical protein
MTILKIIKISEILKEIQTLKIKIINIIANITTKSFIIFKIKRNKLIKMEI